MVAVRVTGMVERSVVVDCAAAAVMIGGDEEGRRTRPVYGIPLPLVTTVVAPAAGVEVRRVVLCLGLYETSGTSSEVCGILLSVADCGTTGPVRMAEVRSVLLLVGAEAVKLWPALTWSSTLAQL